MQAPRLREPLTGHGPPDKYRKLFTPIVNAVPAPIGLGDALIVPQGRASPS